MRNRRAGVFVATGLLLAACGIGDEASSRPQATGGVCSVPDEFPSAARAWNEAALDAIRLDFPAPTVHARNLYHLSASMWDAWVSFDTTDRTDEAAPTPLFVDDRHDTDDIEAARIDAISFAAHRILTHRYNNSLGRAETLDALGDRLVEMCGAQALDTAHSPASSASGPDGPTAAAVGIEIAERIIDATLDDGSLERRDYEDLSYAPVNPPLAVAESGTTLVDPDRWQPLILDVALSQNGLPLPGGEQTFIGSNWGHVTSFALAGDDGGLPIDPGPPPLISDPSTADEYRESALEVVRASSDLQVGQQMIDIGPGAHGGNSLGTDDGSGYDVNPITRKPYPAHVVDLADWARVIAEYWADGPTSETPPGHWNTIANDTSDVLFDDSESDLVALDGREVGRLEWDVKLGVAINGALHDAAIAAWGVKAHYDSVRPISMIRDLGQHGDLPLVDGLVEIVTDTSSAPGERHEMLADHVGEQAIHAWSGSPSDPEVTTSGVSWILAADWVPYQRPTFVTPAFAGYVSGHSTFSRAAAEVLAALTGSEFFPHGIAEFTVSVGGLLHELGPSEDVELQWATYFDAADEAGRSRIYGGIHITADDYAGRRIGSEVGLTALARARSLFGRPR